VVRGLMTMATTMFEAAPATLGRAGRPERFPASEVPLHVRFADIDMMQVLHHSAYLHWFEQIRFHFLARVLELDFAALREIGISFPLTSCSVRFRSSFRFGDQALGYARLAVFRQAKFALHYAVWKAGGRGAPATTGVTTHCFLGRDSRLLLRTPDLIAAAVARAVRRHPDCLVQEGEAHDVAVDA
jgi:YbgC/YbaW family acyl-CoA thioester hydrolase